MNKIKIKYLGKSLYTRNLCQFLETEFKKQNLVKKLNYGLKNCKLENWGCWIKFNDKKIASTITLNLSKNDMLIFDRECEYIFKDKINKNSLFPIYKNVYIKIFSKIYYTDRNKNPYEIKFSFFTNNNTNLKLK